MSPTDRPDWYERGLPHIWLPYTQMLVTPPPLAAERTDGCTITLADGRILTDGIASWWTACHGYNHPAIAHAVQAQLARMPHVMFGGMVHEPALRLAASLADLLPGDLERVFFTDSGSVAVEVAIKIATQYWLNRGVQGRTRLLAFRGGYHGDTLATMAICDPEEGMHALFTGVLPQHIIADLPRDDGSTRALDALLHAQGQDIAAIVVEPLVQGAGGMLFHDPATLRRLRELADRHGVLLILDEIFTGFGRTGTMFACEQAGIVPDIVTLSKALTGGTMALSATVATRRVFEAFLSDDPMHALMHGPTFMANPLACAAANASIALFGQEDRLAQVAAIEAQMRAELETCRGLPGVRDVRVMGAIGVVELDHIADMPRLKAALVDGGVWVRPFRTIVYLTPAFTITAAQLSHLTRTIRTVLAAGPY
ncbi:adenosylmethionine-8-amino-7-oxononanoate aminotransferase [Ameyamaea chiangmaiensis NBRC 103196]|uniref:Adenosylmethionine-8-amino-7-oxononanoate aminotransferase n=1 Tax=Ameyamaea chiangmaiensis TaxID=442969 RepID=A0A850PBV7_9PROT|nr:adenosylmethionine--8-amino-7-oxononanoate transaminase [Ameyamaea chiangmaiensis]MBS4073722.1 adenosylmethionine--8-amino-7-oxononanoate transaminase [Ameyamaea chiangmaiensis]NVN39786.1 adenosylmethionine--8-amino-7-oxononanoate transaminase [Ameyamaea chiangmaiensis]GBQ68687.1 adenosylmethionine-8-amino-7-oxononanoate aminotransferase [Ameyamaea chiangmaiensis NBRC 103196]